MKPPFFAHFFFTTNFLSGPARSPRQRHQEAQDSCERNHLPPERGKQLWQRQGYTWGPSHSCQRIWNFQRSQHASSKGAAQIRLLGHRSDRWGVARSLQVTWWCVSRRFTRFREKRIRLETCQSTRLRPKALKVQSLNLRRLEANQTDHPSVSSVLRRRPYCIPLKSKRVQVETAQRWGRTPIHRLRWLAANRDSLHSLKATPRCIYE